jgi:hypothetical protein
VLAGEPGQPHRLPRAAISVPASLCLRNAFQLVTVEDISLGGMRVTLDLADCVEEKAVASLPGLPPLIGSIRWQQGAQAGITFAEPLEFDLLARWLANLMESR